MSQFAILRVGKLKGWGSVRSAGGHNLRTRTTPNADPDGPPPRVLHGGSDLGDAVADRLREAGVKKPRRDAVLCSEMVLTGSPERMASMSGAELEAWARDNVAWLREEHGANLVQVVLHLDERTPHLHAAVVPVNRDGGLSAKRYWGEAAGLSALQTAYGDRMAPHGLQRGVMGSKAQHATLRAFYGALEAAHSPTPPGPMPSRPRAEDGARLGLVRAGAVADAERGWRRQLVRWGKALLASEEKARLAAAGLASENRAMRRERAATALALTRARTIAKTWRLLSRVVPDDLAALVLRAQRQDRAARLEERRRKTAEHEAAYDREQALRAAAQRPQVAVPAGTGGVGGTPTETAPGRGPALGPSGPPRRPALGPR